MMLGHAMSDTNSIEIASFDDARARAEAISSALRKAARQARAPASLVSGGGGFRERRGGRLFRIGVYISFVLCVIAPILGATVYYGLIASKQYVSESRFSVRNGEQSPMDMLGSFSGFPQAGRFQDALIVTNYIYSRAMIKQIDAALDLHRIFSDPKIDFMSRLPEKDPIEYIEMYWKRQVDVEVDNTSGIITLRVRAFNPKDAYDISNLILKIGEQVVNDLADRTRQDALKQTKAELDSAEAELRKRSETLRDLRNAEGILDVGASASAVSQVVSTLRGELTKLDETYQSNLSVLSKTAPQMKILAGRIEVVKKAIAENEAKLAGVQSAADNLSEKSGKFAAQQLEVDIAQRRYVAASVAYEAAKSEANTQRIYVVTFVTPTVAEKALYPRRFLAWTIISLPALIIWSLGLALAFVIRDYAAA